MKRDNSLGGGRHSRRIRRALKGRRLGHRHRLQIESLESRALLSAAPAPQLVADLNTTPLSSNPGDFITIGKITYFSADDGLHGRELWETDGTAAGTKLVRDINIGIGFSNQEIAEPGSSNPTNLIDAGGMLAFIADDGLHGPQIWKSDGTSAGTIRLTNISSGLYPPPPPTNLVGGNGTIFFLQEADVSTPDFSTAGQELWATNLATGKSQLLRTFIFDSPFGLTGVGGELFFVASDDSNGFALWKSDGTVAGTHVVKDLGGIHDLTTVNGKLYFVAPDDTSGRDQLWSSDGTAAGTVEISDLSNSNPFQFNLQISDFTSSGYKLFSLQNNQVWTSDGTDAGTQLVTDFSTFGSVGFYPQSIDVHGELFVIVYDYPASTYELWKIDGTQQGTQRVGALPGYAPDSYGSNRSDLTLVDGTLYVTQSMTIDITGTEEFRETAKIWASDGTAGGTGQVDDLIGPLQSLVPGLPVGTLLFSKFDPTHGTELWKTDGTAGGTLLVKDINTDTGYSRIADLVNSNGTLYFAVDSDDNGAQLWASDGTAAGTRLVDTVVAGFTNDNVRHLTNVDGKLFFTSGVDEPDGLWTSDGTSTGTVSLSKAFFNVRDLTAVGNKLFFASEYFAANEGYYGYRPALWVSDGTPDGTVVFKSVDPQNIGTYAGSLTNVNGTLFFTVQNQFSQAEELWKTDGTPQGTIELAQTPSVESGSFINVSGELFFVTINSLKGIELWKSDGTPDGTFPIKVLNPALTQSDFYNQIRPVNLNGTLYFSVNDGIHGTELWKSNGTTAGTVMVKDIARGNYPGDGPRSSGPYDLTVVNRTLFFAADDRVHGPELWKSDGTARGTVMVKDILRGNNNYSYPRDLTSANGTLYFAATDSSHGSELWKSNGTAAGTVMVADIRPGKVSSYPYNLTVVNGTLFFTANDGVHGSELWKLTLPAGNANGNGTGTVSLRSFIFSSGQPLATAATSYAAAGSTAVQSGGNSFNLALGSTTRATSTDSSLATASDVQASGANSSTAPDNALASGLITDDVLRQLSLAAIDHVLASTR
jgi:ELWxxDGT repeat protein